MKLTRNLILGPPYLDTPYEYMATTQMATFTYPRLQLAPIRDSRDRARDLKLTINEDDQMEENTTTNTLFGAKAARGEARVA